MARRSTTSPCTNCSFAPGAGSALLVFVVDLVLIAGLYLVLAPVDQPVAVVAALIRTVETALGVGVVVDDLAALRSLSGADAFEPLRRESLTRVAMAAHVDRYASVSATTWPTRFRAVRSPADSMDMENSIQECRHPFTGNAATGHRAWPRRDVSRRG